MPARDQELEVIIGFHKQTGTGLDATTKSQVQTMLASGASFWKPTTREFAVPFPVFNQEDNADFFGKGSEFATQIFPTSLDVNYNISCFLTSQNFAQAIVFGLGSYSETSPGAGSAQYVAVPMVPADDGVNLPLTTIGGGIRQGTAGKIIDIALPGCAVNKWTLRIERGPGLDNTNLTTEWVGCGFYVNNAGITYPGDLDPQEHRLGGGSTTVLSILGVDYIANARMVSLLFEWANNVSLETGYFPGSGQINGFDVRGRMRMGKRSITFSWVVELEATSTELANLLAGTEGETIIQVTGGEISSGVNHRARINVGRCRHKGFEVSSTAGFVTANITTTLLEDETGSLVNCIATTTLAGIGDEP